MDVAFRTLEWLSTSGVADDPVFLAIFSILGYRRLFSDSGSITLLSIVLTGLISFTIARAIHVYRAPHSVLPSPDSQESEDTPRPSTYTTASHGIDGIDDPMSTALREWCGESPHWLCGVLRTVIRPAPSVD
jgi:hypothetical protein